MNLYGRTFLEASVGDVIRRLCTECVAIEVDPVRNGRGTRDVERNVESLVHWCREMWTHIYDVRYDCPQSVHRNLLPSIHNQTVLIPGLRASESYDGCSNIFGCWSRSGTRAKGTTGIENCHGRVSLHSFFFALLSLLYYIPTSLACVLVSVHLHIIEHRVG